MLNHRVLAAVHAFIDEGLNIITNLGPPVTLSVDMMKHSFLTKVSSLMSAVEQVLLLLFTLR